MARIDDARNKIIQEVALSSELEHYHINTDYEKVHCPFHDDGSPSLFWSDDKKVYHCFGCGAAGTVVEFVRRMEMQQGNFLTQKEVVQQLALKYKVEIPDLDFEAIAPVKSKVVQSHQVDPKVHQKKRIERYEGQLKRLDVDTQTVGYYLVDRWYWGLAGGSETLTQLEQLFKTNKKGE